MYWDGLYPRRTLGFTFPPPKLNVTGGEYGAWDMANLAVQLSSQEHPRRTQSKTFYGIYFKHARGSSAR